jgi:hypothetical protein
MGVAISTSPAVGILPMGSTREIHIVTGSAEFIKTRRFHSLQFLDRGKATEVLSVNNRSKEKHIAASMRFVAIGAGKNIVLVRIVIRGFQGSIDGGCAS